MATAIAMSTAGVAGSSVSSIVSSISQYIRDSMKMIFSKITTYIKEISKQVSSILSRATHAIIHGVSTIASTTGRKIVSVSRSTFRQFYKIIRDVSTRPEGVFLAVVMYRLINLQIPDDPDVYGKTLDDIASQIESFTIPSVNVPVVNIPLERFAEKVFDALTSAEGKLEEWKTAIDEINSDEIYNRIIEMGGANKECTMPAWYDVGGWFGYVFCVIRNGLVVFGAVIAKALVELVKIVAKFMLTVVKPLIYIAKYIAYFVLTAIDRLFDVVAGIVVPMANAITNALIGIANFLVNFLIKAPAKLFIKYVVKPAVLFTVSIARWFKSNMERALCWYIRVSPWIIGGISAVRNASSGKILSTLGSLLFVPIAVSALTSVAVPECVSQNIEQDLQAPPEPVDLAPYTMPPSTLTVSSAISMSSRTIAGGKSIVPVRVLSTVALSSRHRSTTTVTAPTNVLSTVTLSSRHSTTTTASIPATISSTVRLSYVE